MVCGIALTFIRSGGEYSWTLTGNGLARGLGIWLIGALAVAVSKSENALRNGVLTVLSVLGLSVFGLVRG